MNKKKAAKGKNNPVYTQQDDSALLESTGTNPPDADPAQTSNQTGNEGKADSHLPNVHKDAAEKLSKKDDEQDGEAEVVDERDEDRK
ncbi:MAG: hypothetical protein C0469_13905 [Cyanobacteria bacterium DS2.3.42]|nr:hypothetical protein [Cyanobacteria bacterium DS2.3.42]